MSKVFVVMTLLLCCITGFAQQPAEMTSAQEVKAGEVVTFTVTLDKEPAFDDPAILVIAGPKGGGPGVQNTAIAKNSKTEYRASLRIPATAVEGTWVVRHVRLLVPAGRSVPLKSDAAEFRVVRTQPLDLPTQASVSLAR
jgi:hypothetical protein